MKYFKILMMALLTTLLFNCNSAGSNPSSNENSAPLSLAESAKISSEPANLISLDDARKQLNYYKAAHPGVNGDEYALRTWLSIEQLENYIAFVKEESKKKNITVNGIEFIFTQHKEGKPFAANLNNAEYELTFMYAPTYEGQQKHIAFDPLRSEDGKPADLSELLSQQESGESNTEDKDGKPSSDKSGIANLVNPCPTLCE